MFWSGKSQVSCRGSNPISAGDLSINLLLLLFIRLVWEEKGLNFIVPSGWGAFVRLQVA